MKKIKIGATRGALPVWCAGYAKYSFEEKGVESEQINFETHTEVQGALLCGDVDMTVRTLNELPTKLPEGISIAGLSFRENASDCLLIRQDEYAENQLFKLKNGAKVAFNTPLQQAQLLGYRSDLQMVHCQNDIPNNLAQLQAGDFDAMLAAFTDLARLRLELDGVEKVILNVREFVPPPGQGVLAYLCCSDDLETRRLIQQHLHEPNTSAVTNVERKALQLLGGDPQLPLGVFCERDNSGNLHAWAALAESTDGSVRRFRLSQSTSFGLAEKLVVGLG